MSRATRLALPLATALALLGRLRASVPFACTSFVLAVVGCNPPAPTAGGSPAPGESLAPTAVPTTAPTAAASPSPVATASAAPTPAATPTPTPAPTAPPEQRQAGEASAQAVADRMGDDRRLLAYDMMADDGEPVAARRLLQLEDTDAKEAEAAAKDVALTAAGRTAARARRAAVKAAAKAKLDAMVDAKKAVAAAMARAASRNRVAGGKIRSTDFEITAAGGAWTVKLVRVTDASGDLIHSVVRATHKVNGRVVTRTRTLRADGGATVKFNAAPKTLWSRADGADGAVTGSGVVAVGVGAAEKTLLVTLGGTDVAPTVTLKDPAAKLDAEVALPVGGEPTAALLRLDVAGAREALKVTAE